MKDIDAKRKTKHGKRQKRYVTQGTVWREKVSNLSATVV